MAQPRSPFLRALLRDHSHWAIDLVRGDAPPRGWQPLVLAAFAALDDAMLVDPTSRILVTRVDEHEGRLRMEFGGDIDRPPPPSVMGRLSAIVDEATRDAADRCPRCGRLVGTTTQEDGVAPRLAHEPDCTPSAAMKSMLASLDAWVAGRLEV